MTLIKRLLVRPDKVIPFNMRFFLVLILFIYGGCVVPKRGLSSLSSDHNLHPTLLALEDSIRHYATIMHSSDAMSERVEASQSVKFFVEKALANRDSWDFPFDRISEISVQLAPDNAFRIFTWQLFVDKGRFQHFGYLQMKGKESKVYPLINRSPTILHPESHTSGTDEWYGALYYRIFPFRSEGEKYWLLFGFDSFSAQANRKLIDVVYFDEQLRPQFGAPVFHYLDTTGAIVQKKNRLLLEYAAASKIVLNYDEHLEMILFDHLMPFSDDRKGTGLRYIPDGTYEGFKLKKGQWIHVEKVFNKTMDEAPVDFPVLDGRRDRDLFGKERR